MITFLLRAAFWMCVVILVMPADEPASRRSASVAEAPMTTGSIGAGAATAGPLVSDADVAAGQRIVDLARFCARNAETCAAGAALIEAAGETAQTTVLAILELIARGTATLGNGRGAAAGADTLEPADRTVPWQGPGAQG